MFVLQNGDILIFKTDFKKKEFWVCLKRDNKIYNLFDYLDKDDDKKESMKDLFIYLPKEIYFAVSTSMPHDGYEENMIVTLIE